MNAHIAALRPNYIVADFKAGQSVLLKCNGLAGVPRFMHGAHAVVVKVTSKRIVLMVGVNGKANRELRVTPNQVQVIIEETPERW